MANKNKQDNVEREYIINLRREILKVPRYRRTPKAVKAIKQFIAKHMRVEDRDLRKIKLDRWLNHELWHRGIQNPPTKIKVKVKKEGENIIAKLAEIPEILKFRIARDEKLKESAEKIKKAKKLVSQEKVEEKPEDKTEEKVEEKEKEAAVKETEIKHADLQAKEQKHTEKMKPAKTPKIQRKALQK